MQAEATSKTRSFGATVRHIANRGAGQIGTRCVCIPRQLAEDLDLRPGHNVLIRLEKLSSRDE